MQIYDDRQVKAFLAATRRMIDPGRTAMRDRSPYAVTGGQALNPLQLIAAGQAAGEDDADLIHLEFSPGAETDGPVNVMASISWGNVFVRREYRFWLDPRGRPFLVARQGVKYGTMSFDPDGMDSRPGRPKGSLEKGYARADATLRRYAAETLAVGGTMAA